MALLLAGCTATQQRHLVEVPRLETTPEAGPGRVLFDFSAPDAAQAWKPYVIEGSVNPPVCALVDGALCVTSDRSAGLFWHAVNFRPEAEPLLRWRWKVSGHLPDATPLSPELDNFPARVLVGFDSGWEGADGTALAWRRKVEDHTGVTPPARCICYTFGGREPSANAIDAAFGQGRIVVINLRTPASAAGMWHEEVRDLAADYEAVFGEPAPAVATLALASDSHRVGGCVSAWFDDFVLHGPEARQAFAGRLAPVHERMGPPLWRWAAALGGAAAGLCLAGWLWVRRASRRASRRPGPDSAAQ